MSGAGRHGGAAVVRRPYVDSLVDLRVPHENDDDDDDTRAKCVRALTEDEMVSLIVEFLGTVESIVAALEWMRAHLVAQQEVQTKLRYATR